MKYKYILGSIIFVLLFTAFTTFAVTKIFSFQGGTGQDSSAWSGLVKVTSGTWATSTIATSDISLTSGNFLVGDASGLGSATSSIFIDSSGNIGVATSTPSAIFTIGAIENNQLLVNSSGVVTGGTWQGTAIADAYVANDITLTNITQITNRAITDTTGTLTVARGGTEATSFTDGGVIVGNGSGALQVTAVGTAGQVLTSNGAGSDPTFQATSSNVLKVFTNKRTTCSNAGLVEITDASVTPVANTKYALEGLVQGQIANSSNGFGLGLVTADTATSSIFASWGREFPALGDSATTTCMSYTSTTPCNMNKADSGNDRVNISLKGTVETTDTGNIALYCNSTSASGLIILENSWLKLTPE